MLTGVSFQALSSIERGQTKSLKGTTARNLARGLQVTTDELLDHVPVTA